MSKLRILLAEDHAMVREGLRLIVNSQPDMEVVGEAADGRAVVRQAEALSPDVILMDVSMPQVNGVRAAETLQQACPRAKILIVTRHAEAGYLRELLRAGASGYVLKQSQSAELLRAIRAVWSQGHYIDSALAGEIVREYGRKPTRVPAEAAETLTSREEEVLRLIARGYTNKEIAGHLGLSVKTVETHKANAMQKTELHSRIDVVRFAVLRGWLDDM